MEREQHKTIINQLLTMCATEHQATASDLLTQLSEDYEKTLATVSESSEQVKKLTANNETLREVNAKLFLKVGETPKTTATAADNQPPEKNDEKTLSFEQLFNEKGELL